MRWAIIGWIAAGCTAGQAQVGTNPDGTGPGTIDPTGVGGDDDDNGTVTGPGSCKSWLATYDLTGSHFYIQNALADFTITVQEPYTDDLNTGPGQITLRFPDNGGKPGPGTLQWIEYKLVFDFVTGVAGLASVHSEIDNNAGPEECGMTTGDIAGDTLAWAPATIDVCQEGQISCTGGFCGTSGSPPEGEPQIVSGCEPWAVNEFTFSPDLQTFEMAAALVSDDGDTQTAMQFHAELIEAVEDPAPPDCACGG